MKSIIHTFREFVQTTPNKVAFLSIENKEAASITYGELDKLVQGKVQLLEFESGNSVLLLYDDAIDWCYHCVFSLPNTWSYLCSEVYTSNKRHWGFRIFTKRVMDLRKQL